MDIYINSAAQISIQEPLCQTWLEKPLYNNVLLASAIDPDYKPFVSPIAARRMGKLLKRAIATTRTCLTQAQTEQVDAIICGTGLGCVEDTEKFLTQLVTNGEHALPPTHFMLSTHNTIAAHIALQLGCHGYNSTYSHGGISFASALLDAVMQFQLTNINTALVGGFDEITRDYFTMLIHNGYWKNSEISTETLREANTAGSFAGETAVSLLLGREKTDNALCKLRGTELLHKPSDERMTEAIDHLLQSNGLTRNDIDAVFMGLSGDCEGDAVYRRAQTTLFDGKPVAWYKHLFGESFTADGLGLYAAAYCLHAGEIPAHMLYKRDQNVLKNVNNILIYNHFKNTEHSLTLLSRC